MATVVRAKTTKEVLEISQTFETAAMEAWDLQAGSRSV